MINPNDYEAWRRLEIAKRRLAEYKTPKIKYCGVYLEEFTQTELIKIVGLADQAGDEYVPVPVKLAIPDGPGKSEPMQKLFNQLMKKYKEKGTSGYFGTGKMYDGPGTPASGMHQSFDEFIDPEFEEGNAVTVKPNMGVYSGKSGVVHKIEFKDVAWVRFPGVVGEVSIRFKDLKRFDYSKADWSHGE